MDKPKPEPSGQFDIVKFQELLLKGLPAPHTGLFTALSPMALPGGIHVYTAKSAEEGAAWIYEDSEYDRLSASEREHRQRIRDQWRRLHEEESELMELIEMITMTGILDT